jgi:hypothetical protein
MLALGFGDSQAKALDTVHRSLKEDSRRLKSDYIKTWHRYADRLVSPRRPQGVSGSRWNACSTSTT